MPSVGTGLKQKRFKKKTHSRSTAKNDNYAIVRVMGHGQFKVDNRTAKKINKIDNELVKIIQIGSTTIMLHLYSIL